MSQNKGVHSIPSQVKQLNQLRQLGLAPIVYDHGQNYLISDLIAGPTRLEQNLGRASMSDLSKYQFDRKIIELLDTFEKNSIFPMDIENIISNIAYDPIQEKYLIFDPGGLITTNTKKQAWKQVKELIRGYASNLALYH